MRLDPEKYRKYVDNFDLTEEEKLQLMEQVWAIMESFVDRAFGESPEQAIMKSRSTTDNGNKSG